MNLTIIASFFISIEVVSTSGAILYPDEYDTCLPNCNCSGSAMRCDSYIPFAIPSPFRQLIISNIDSEELQPRRFCGLDDSWDTLEELQLASVKSKAGQFNLLSKAFDCLDNLAGFRLGARDLKHFDSGAFRGLSQVTLLDLSGCEMMNWDDMVYTLSVVQNFPKLDHLILSGAGKSRGVPLKLDDAFVNALSTRPIAHLDLSYTYFKYMFSNSKHLCRTLSYLNCAGASIQRTERFEKASVCGSLRILDSSGNSHYKVILKDSHCIDDTLNMTFVSRFYAALEVIFLKRIFTPATNFKASNCKLNLFYDSVITDIHFGQNYLPDFGFELNNERVKFIDLSYCSIENINNNAFKGLKSLREMDLSNNKLAKMSFFQKQFSGLFQYNAYLESVHLNGNELTYIPGETFVENANIKNLDLSNNSLTQVHFRVSHLLELKLLDLRFNNIEVLDDVSRQTLDTLYANQIQANKTETVQALLQENPFTCNCRDLSFLQWFANSPMFTTTRHEYKCRLLGQNFRIVPDGVNAAKEGCEKITLGRLMVVLLSTLLPSAGLVILFTGLILYRKRKKHLMKQRFANSIQRLRKHPHRFPVFLSYSSEDNEFVRRHMLQPMQDQLQIITDLDRELVCNADLHFHPARTILSEIFHWLKLCNVFVAVISKNYCKSRFCRYEIEHAHLLGIPIILVFMEHVPEEDMNLITREVFETFTRVQFVYENDQPILRPGWQQLCESILQLVGQSNNAVRPQQPEDDIGYRD